MRKRGCETGSHTVSECRCGFGLSIAAVHESSSFFFQFLGGARTVQIELSSFARSENVLHVYSIFIFKYFPRFSCLFHVHFTFIYNCT